MLAAASLVSAQTQPSDMPIPVADMLGGALTLQNLQQLALQHNPSIAEARALTWRANGRRVQAGLYPNPRIGVLSTEIGNEGFSGQHGVFIEQEIVRGGKLDSARSVAAVGQQQAEQILAAQERRVLNAVRREFYAVLAADRLQGLAKSLVEVAQRAEQLAGLRQERAEGTRNEVLLARIESENAALILNEAENRYRSAWQQLRAVIAAPDLRPVPLIGDLDGDVPTLIWADVWSRLVAESPQLRHAQLEVDRARKALQRACLEPIPNVTVQASTQYDESTDTQFAGVQVGLPLPLFDRNQGNIMAARGELMRASHDAERIEQRLRLRLAEVFEAYAVARTQVARYRDHILPATRESLALSRTAFQVEEISYLELLTAQRTYTQVNQQYVRSLAKLWQSIASLEAMLLVDGLAEPGLDLP